MIGLALAHIEPIISKEVCDIEWRNVAESIAINTGEGGGGLKVWVLADDLALDLNAALALSNFNEETSQLRLSVGTKHPKIRINKFYQA